MNDAKNCTINLWNEHGWELDQGMLEAVLTRVVARNALEAERINIYPSEREAMELSETKKYFRDGPGWLEWHVNIKYRSGSSMSIVVIQRTVGAPFESHS